MYISNDADAPKDVPFEDFDYKNVPGIKTPKTTKKWPWLGNWYTMTMTSDVENSKN